MVERGHFLIDMQKTGPKLAIFHGFFGQNVKKIWPLRLKKSFFVVRYVMYRPVEK